MKPAVNTELQRAVLELQFAPGVLGVALVDERGRPLAMVGAEGIGPVLLGDYPSSTVGVPDSLARLIGEGELSQVSDGSPNAPPSLHCVLLPERHLLFVIFDSSAVTLEAVRARSRETVDEVSAILAKR